MLGNDDQTADRLFFSSSRPEALGGYDIFQVDGNLTGVTVELVQSNDAIQLLFEINSTADEFLYWENEEEGKPGLPPIAIRILKGGKSGGLLWSALSWRLSLFPL